MCLRLTDSLSFFSLNLGGYLSLYARKVSEELPLGISADPEAKRKLIYFCFIVVPPAFFISSNSLIRNLSF